MKIKFELSEQEYDFIIKHLDCLIESDLKSGQRRLMKGIACVFNYEKGVEKLDLLIHEQED